MYWGGSVYKQEGRLKIRTRVGLLPFAREGIPGCAEVMSLWKGNQVNVGETGDEEDTGEKTFHLHK